MSGFVRARKRLAGFNFKPSQRYNSTPALTYPSIRTCPEPKCTCEPMPKDLDIDYKRQLYGTVAPYFDHILLHTGTADWSSRIEDDKRYPLVREIKAKIKESLLGESSKRGANLLVSTSSFEKSTIGTNMSTSGAVVSVIKAGLHITVESDHTFEFSKSLVKYATEDSWAELKRQFTTRPIEEVIVLICGHGNRDIRCGIMGPLLAKEFQEKLSSKGFKLPGDHLGNVTSNGKSAKVGLVSHVGGHAFAGNVIIYIPATREFENHSLVGKGIWYGRIEPKHVEGIVEKTISDGVIIEDLLRGVV